MSWAVIVSRIVDPFEPRKPLVIGPFRDQSGAIVKRAAIMRGLDRAGLDRDVYIVPVDRGATPVRTIVEDAA